MALPPWLSALALVALPVLVAQAQPRPPAPSPAASNSASGSARAPASAPARSSASALASAPVSPQTSGPEAPKPRGTAPRMTPDPEPLVSQRKWVYEVFYHDGALFTPTPRLRDLGKPIETPRRVGRFAVELYSGPDLIERVRFELPLLNGDQFSGQARRPAGAPPDFEKKARVRASVEVPVTDRATHAILLDRATGHRVRLPWSPLAK